MIIAPEVLCLLMFIAVCGALLLGFPVAFTLAGVSAIFAFIGYFLSDFDLTILLAFPQRIFGNIIRNEVLIAVPLFILMGVVLERARIAEELLENMGRLFGSFPGGIAFSVTLVGALMAASTGIVGATVVAMGLLSLPTMLRYGYSKSIACGSITAAGTLGQIIPPSIVLVLLGDQLSSAYQNAQFEMGIFSPDTVSINDLFAGAMLPGLLLVGLYLGYQLMVALVNPSAMPAVTTPLADQSGHALGHLFKTLLMPLLLIILVLGSILGGLASPTEAAGVGATGAILLAGYRISQAKANPIIFGVLAFAGLVLLAITFDLRIQRNTISWIEMAAIFIAVLLSAILALAIVLALIRCNQAKTANGDTILGSSLKISLLLSTKILVIIIGATMFSLVFRGLNGDEYIEQFLTNLPGGTFAAIAMVMAIMFLLGFFLDFLEIIFIVVPIVAPILLQLTMPDGSPISPVWLGVMMAVNLQTSFLTPPFGFALFYLRGVAPDSIKTLDIYKGVIPFIALQLLALVLLSYFPTIATWLPSMLYSR